MTDAQPSHPEPSPEEPPTPQEARRPDEPSERGTAGSVRRPYQGGRPPDRNEPRAPTDLPPPPSYRPGSAQPRLNRPVQERYPQIRPTSGYGDPRIGHTGPGPGAGGEQEPERSSKLTARLLLAMTVVVGQLWGLTVVVNEWMRGETTTAWWGAGFLCLSFLVVLGLWALDPKDR